MTIGGQMTAEAWLPIFDYEGYYEVSDWGRVRSLSRMVRRSNDIYPMMGRILVPDDGLQYLRISLAKDGDARNVFVHRLVAEAFLPNPEKLPFVNHIDGNKQNNSLRNLEWCTKSQNARHAVSVLRRMVMPIIAYKRGIGFWFPSQSLAARDLGVTQGMISRVLAGRARQTRGYFLQRSSFGADVLGRVGNA